MIDVGAALDQLSSNNTNGVSPKVAVPGFIGLAATVLVCTGGQYGIHLDAGSAVGIVVLVMSLAGYISKHITSSKTIASSTSSNPQIPAVTAAEGSRHVT